MQAGSEQLPAVTLERQRLEAASAGRQGGGRARLRPPERAVLVGSPVPLRELLAEGIEATLRRFTEALRQSVERLDHDLRVSETAQRSRNLTVAVVLASPDFVTELLPDQAQSRANLLDVLARLVHRIGGVGALLPAQLCHGIVDLGREDPLETRAHRLAPQQPI